MGLRLLRASIRTVAAAGETAGPEEADEGGAAAHVAADDAAAAAGTRGKALAAAEWGRHECRQRQYWEGAYLCLQLQEVVDGGTAAEAAAAVAYVLLHQVQPVCCRLPSCFPHLDSTDLLLLHAESLLQLLERLLPVVGLDAVAAAACQWPVHVPSPAAADTAEAADVRDASADPLQTPVLHLAVYNVVGEGA